MFIDPKKFSPSSHFLSHITNFKKISQTLKNKKLTFFETKIQKALLDCFFFNFYSIFYYEFHIFLVINLTFTNFKRKTILFFIIKRVEDGKEYK